MSVLSIGRKEKDFKGKRSEKNIAHISNLNDENNLKRNFNIQLEVFRSLKKHKFNCIKKKKKEKKKNAQILLFSLFFVKLNKRK